MFKIAYAIDPETGLTYSRVDDKVAVPVKDKRNRFGTWDYKLMVFSVSGLGADEWQKLDITKKLPKSLKSYHNKFWSNVIYKGKETA